MKKTLLIIFLLLMVSGCDVKDSRVTPTASPNRFLDTGIFYGFGANSYSLFRDTETDYLYLVNKSLEGTGITPLLDKDGKPTKELPR